MNIKDLMHTPAISCRRTDSLDTAAGLMWEHDCGVITVLGDEGQLVGVITDRDICMAAYTQGRAPKELSVADAMAKQVYFARPDDSVTVAEALMKDHQVRRVPIVDAQDKPVGVLSVNDLARYAVSPRGKDVQREVVQTLAAVCTPRAGATATDHASAVKTHPRPAASL